MSTLKLERIEVFYDKFAETRSHDRIGRHVFYKILPALVSPLPTHDILRGPGEEAVALHLTIISPKNEKLIKKS